MKVLLLAMLLLCSADLVLTRGTYTARTIHGVLWLAHNVAGATRKSIWNG